jgi:CDGSH-type Zn-finger protein
MSDGEGEPVASQDRPYVIEVEEGQKIAWCACGRSANQPFCDGSHSREQTGIVPIVFQAEKTGKIALCGCRRSEGKPYCDGSHSKED